jgi:hypothetical protein
LDLCLSKGNVPATEKVIRNLMHFAAADPETCPPVRTDPTQVELGVILLEAGTAKQNGQWFVAWG